MNSNSTIDIQERVQLIFDWLQEERIVQEIDYPIDEATAYFMNHDKSPATKNNLLEMAGGFLQFLYAYGIRPHQQLSKDQACCEVFHLLDHHYQGMAGSGYVAAILDWRQSGKELVLPQIAEILKSEMRSKYVHWVYARYLIPLDIPTQSQMAEFLFQQYRSFLPEEMLRSSPIQWISYLPSLIQICQKVDLQLQKIINQ